MPDKSTPSVPLHKLMRDCVMEPIVCAERIPEIHITSTDINRPGLQLAGFFDYFGTTASRSSARWK
jgi:HPr kinase/phosphorylase